jgi:hypothetical protein
MKKASVKKTTRKGYKAPKLTVYGKVSELTQGGRGRTKKRGKGHAHGRGRGKGHGGSRS